MKKVIEIKIYIDVIFLLNFIVDLILLILVSIVLKRKVNFFRFILGALIGSFSMIILFIRLNQNELIFIKIIISIFMILTTFGFRDKIYFIKNLYYLYIFSILLGGIIYFFNNNVLFIKYKIINLYFISFLSLLILIFYIKQLKSIKNTYNKYYDIKIRISKKTINLVGFLDTGNRLKSPYDGKPIILIDKKYININNENVLLVPFSSINDNGLLKCIKSDNICINGKYKREKYLIGLIENTNIDGIDCILSEKILEG